MPLRLWISCRTTPNPAARNFSDLFPGVEAGLENPLSGRLQRGRRIFGLGPSLAQPRCRIPSSRMPWPLSARVGMTWVACCAACRVTILMAAFPGCVRTRGESLRGTKSPSFGPLRRNSFLLSQSSIRAFVQPRSIPRDPLLTQNHPRTARFVSHLGLADSYTGHGK